MVKSANKKSFLKRVLIFIVSVLAFVAMLCMVLCVVNPLVSPNTEVWTSYFGLAFWPLLLVNIILLLVLILLKAGKSLLISIFAIVIAIPGFMRSCSVKKALTEPGNVKIMTYNTANFTDVNDNQRTHQMVKNDVIALINSEKPDVVCLQESGSWSTKNAVGFGKQIGCEYYAVNEHGHHGNIIFSKFPIADDEFTKRFNAMGGSGFVKLIKSKSVGTFYVENTHLQSYNITKDELEYVSDAPNYVENSSKGKSIIKKLKDGLETRTGDTQYIVDNLPDNNIPIIICGDFNDTPMSYTYKQMRKAGFTDSFLEVGNGVGITYCGNLPMLRIDYIWHGENINVFTCEVLKTKLSDHYPIVATFNVSD